MLHKRTGVTSVIIVLLLLLGSTILIANSAHTGHQTAASANQAYLPLLATTRTFDLVAIPDESVTFNQITDIVHANDDRLFVTEQSGKIYTIHSDNTVSQLLNLSDKVLTTPQGSWEQGLLTLAFHPEFATNGYLFVVYNENGIHLNSGDLVLARFTFSTVSGQVDPDSEVVLLTIPKVTGYHNGSRLVFGPHDGYLYMSIGDDQQILNPLDLTTLKGKLIRIDVDGGTPYAIPPDNPFVDSADARGEIWAIGLRNPWRISIDPGTGDLYIGDAGWHEREEINYQPGSDSGSAHYGWPCYEGTQRTTHLPSICATLDAHVLPVYEYSHAVGCAIIGGHVYRGALTHWQGTYFFSDLCSRHVTALRQDSAQNWVAEMIGQAEWGYQVSTLGVDSLGELYMASRYNDKNLYRIVLP